MFIIGYFFQALALVADMVLNAYMLIIIIHAILSWIRTDPYNPVVRFLDSVTLPVLSAIRKRIPLMYSGIDFTPALVILAIYFLKFFLVGTLGRIAANFL